MALRSSAALASGLHTLSNAARIITPMASFGGTEERAPNAPASPTSGTSQVVLAMSSMASASLVPNMPSKTLGADVRASSSRVDLMWMSNISMTPSQSVSLNWLSMPSLRRSTVRVPS